MEEYNQGRTDKQLESSYRIFGLSFICFVFIMSIMSIVDYLNKSDTEKLIDDMNETATYNRNTHNVDMLFYDDINY